MNRFTNKISTLFLTLPLTKPTENIINLFYSAKFQNHIQVGPAIFFYYIFWLSFRSADKSANDIEKMKHK